MAFWLVDLREPWFDFGFSYVAQWSSRDDIWVIFFGRGYVIVERGKITTVSKALEADYWKYHGR